MHYSKNHLKKNSSIIFVLVFSFIIAILLSILPLPYQFKWFMPNWVVLVLIYWIIFTDGIIGLGFTFGLGMLVDLLLGNFLGTTSLYLMPVTFFADRLAIRFKNLALFQQFLVIIVLISLSHLIRLWLQLYIKHPTNNMQYWLTIPTSIIMWPFVCGLINLFRKAINFC